MEVLPGELGMSALPNEIRLLILGKLKVQDLLRCRLVSRLWKSISTELCRQRHVKLRNKWFEDPKGLDIFKVFDHDDIPWSSYALSDLPDNVGALNEPFITKFSSHLWETKMGGDYSLVNRWLRMTPNLRSLVLEGMNELTPGEDMSQLEPGSLPMLKTLEVQQFDEGALIFLESFIAAVPRLEQIKIGELYLDDSDSTERAVSVLANIRILDLSFACGTSPEVFRGLAKATIPLRIRKLELCLCDSCLEDWGPFLPHLNSKYLQTLELNVLVIPAGKLNPSFKFPEFKALKHLIIYLPVSTRSFCPDFTRDIFSRVDPQDFPVLERVDIGSTRSSENFVLFNPTSCFERVRELRLFEDHFLEDKWIHLFPNITKLKIEITTLYPFIFSFQKLQYLNIWIGSVDEVLGNRTDLNVLLSGIQDPDSLYLESEEVIAKYRETHPNSSFHQLTELKKLKIVFGGNLARNQLRDAAACLTFLNMHKLDTLHFRGLEISEECEAKLKAHHRNFVREPYQDSSDFE